MKETGIWNPGNARLWNPESRVCNLESIVWNPESMNVLGIQDPGYFLVEPLSLESGIQDLRSGVHYSGSGISRAGIWNPWATWLSLHRAKQESNAPH